MFLGKFSPNSVETFWGEGENIEQVIGDIESQYGDTVHPNNVKFYCANEIEVTMRVEYIIEYPIRE